jgi:hypothetical protein
MVWRGRFEEWRFSLRRQEEPVHHDRSSNQAIKQLKSRFLSQRNKGGRLSSLRKQGSWRFAQENYRTPREAP